MAKMLFADDPIKGKITVGEIEGDKLIKRVRRSVHYFKMMKGYALQETAFQAIRKQGITTIEIRESDTRNVLTASVDTWFEHGGLWTGKSGKQRTLSEKYMEITDESKEGPNGS